MKIIITEEQFNRFNRSSPALQNGIIKYLNQYLEKGTRKITPKSRGYGNLFEDWCIDGKEGITATYYFHDGEFFNGNLMVSKEIIDTISKIFSVRTSYILHVIEEWYEDTMVPKFEKMVGESGLSIGEIYVMSTTDDCVPEPTKPEGVTDEEMIDFIDKNTAYRRQEIIDKIESGEEDLEDFYLHIVDIVNRKRIQGEQFNRFIKEEEEDNIFQFNDDSRMGKMINQSIKYVGFASTIRLFGGLDKIKDYIKTIDFTRKDKIEFIKYVFDQVGGTSFSEIYENPIPYDTDDDNTHQEIAYMTKDSVIVDVYGGYEFNTHVNRISSSIREFKDRYIDKIFEISLNVAENNDL
jgi:hypothetical protein